MNNPVRVQVLQSIDDLLSIALDLELVQSLAPLEKFIQTLVLTKLEKYVNAFRVLEEVHELANILVLDGSMDLDFGHQLLLGSASLQRGLVDDLGCTNTLRLALHKLIALGKATLSKEFTLDVLAERGVSVLVLDSLLDDLGIGAAVATRAVKVGLAAASGGST